LTAEKLYTSIIAALRSYQDLMIIRKSKEGLQKIVESSTTLFEPETLKRSVREFISAALFQLSSLLKANEGVMYTSCFAAEKQGDDFAILGGMDKFNENANKPASQVVSRETYEKLEEARRKKQSCFFGNEYVSYFETSNGTENVIYLSANHEFNEFDKQLLEIFSTNIIAAFDHILMNQEMVATQKEIIITLSEVTETRSKETAKHVKRVAEYSYSLAKAYGLSEEEAQIIKSASPLHDIGKIGISDSILKKPGKLTKEEYEKMKQHTKIGYEILKSSKRDILQTAAIIAYQHHEHWNGNGYPQGLKGEEINIYGRIVALVDVFDALTQKRIYKEPWPLERVLKLLKEERGAQFDPKVVDDFFKSIDEILKIKDEYPD